MPTKIDFILLSNSKKPLPSTRISMLNMLPYLQEAGFHAEIVYEPEETIETPDVSGVWERIVKERIEIAYFQKVHGPSAMETVRKLP